MDSLAYKTLLCHFFSGLQQISEEIELAADGELDEEAAARAIANAQRKLAEYDECLKTLAGEPEVLRQQFVDQHAYDVSVLRRNLEIATEATR